MVAHVLGDSKELFGGCYVGGDLERKKGGLASVGHSHIGRRHVVGGMWRYRGVEVFVSSHP